MISSMAAAGAVSVLLDLIPVAGGIMLLIAFIRGRNKRRREEKELEKVIAAFSEEVQDE